MYLHITPESLGKMYYYDIIYLFRRYESYVEEVNKNSEEKSSENSSVEEMYQSQMDAMRQSVDSMTKKFQIPKI